MNQQQQKHHLRMDGQRKLMWDGWVDRLKCIYQCQTFTLDSIDIKHTLLHSIVVLHCIYHIQITCLITVGWRWGEEGGGGGGGGVGGRLG